MPTRTAKVMTRRGRTRRGGRGALTTGASRRRSGRAGGPRLAALKHGDRGVLRPKAARRLERSVNQLREQQGRNRAVGNNNDARAPSTDSWVSVAATGSTRAQASQATRRPVAVPTTPPRRGLLLRRRAFGGWAKGLPLPVAETVQLARSARSRSGSEPLRATADADHVAARKIAAPNRRGTGGAERLRHAFGLPRARLVERDVGVTLRAALGVPGGLAVANEVDARRSSAQPKRSRNWSGIATFFTEADCTSPKANSPPGLAASPSRATASFMTRSIAPRAALEPRGVVHPAGEAREVGVGTKGADEERREVRARRHRHALLPRGARRRAIGGFCVMARMSWRSEAPPPTAPQGSRHRTASPKSASTQSPIILSKTPPWAHTSSSGVAAPTSTSSATAAGVLSVSCPTAS